MRTKYHTVALTERLSTRLIYYVRISLRMRKGVAMNNNVSGQATSKRLEQSIEGKCPKTAESRELRHSIAWNARNGLTMTETSRTRFDASNGHLGAFIARSRTG